MAHRPGLPSCARMHPDAQSPDACFLTAKSTACVHKPRVSAHARGVLSTWTPTGPPVSPGDKRHIWLVQLQGASGGFWSGMLTRRRQFPGPAPRVTAVHYCGGLWGARRHVPGLESVPIFVPGWRALACHPAGPGVVGPLPGMAGCTLTALEARPGTRGPGSCSDCLRSRVCGGFLLLPPRPRFYPVSSFLCSSTSLLVLHPCLYSALRVVALKF